MALRFLDSFDHYTPAQAATKWTYANSVGRDTGLHGYGIHGQLRKGMLFPHNVIILEAYVKSGPGTLLFQLADTAGNRQCGCDVNNDGAIEVSRAGSDPSLTLIHRTAPDLIRNGEWYHFGWRVFVDVHGSVVVRLNGEVVVNIPDTDTTATTYSSLLWNGTLGSFEQGDYFNFATFDDLVVMDDVADGIADPRLPGGGGFTQFLGPVTIKVKRPNGAGSVAGWTGVPTSPNWANVDDIESDDDATYNVATVAQTGASDLFAMEDLLPGEDVLAVQSCVLARKTDDGIAAIAKLTNDGTTTRAGATVYQPGSYAYMHAPEPTAPDGSLWTAAKWNAIQYGYKRIV